MKSLLLSIILLPYQSVIFGTVYAVDSADFAPNSSENYEHL